MGFLTFAVNDIAKAKSFYVQTHGLKVRDNPIGMIDVEI